MPLKIKATAVVCLLALACFAAYGTSLSNGFLIDDALVVQQNPLIKNLLLTPRYFTQPFLKFYYRPLTHLSLALDYRVWKGNPFGYHLTSVFLHFLNAALLFVLLYLLWENVALSTVTSLLFAVHPVYSIPVHYVADRGTLLSALFMLAALIFFCLAQKRSQPRFYLPGFLFFMGSLLSHESSILFPLYLLCASAVIGQKPDKEKVLRLLGAVFLVSLGYYLFRTRFLSFGGVAFPDVSWLQYAQNLPSFLYAVVRSVALVVFPVGLCLITAIDPALTSGFWPAFYFFSAVVSAALVWVRFRKNRMVLFSLAWFFIGALPLYNLMFARPEMGLIMQENRLYFCSIGLLILLAACFVRLEKALRRWLWALLIAAVLLSYGSIVVVDNALWKDEKTYCSYWLRCAPRNPFALCTLGQFYGNRGDYRRADAYFWRGIDCFKKEKNGRLTNELIPGQLLGILFNNLAVNADRESKIDEAIRYARSAVTIDEYNADGYDILGYLYSRQGDFDEAIRYYRESVRINPNRAQAHQRLAALYLIKGDKGRALEEVRTAVRIDPDCYETPGSG
jgi:tetratricopeptide (TPR) repeat protein